ncbi:AMP-dependent synthetase/ligase [Aquipuribacter nitratireducens]|uniref:Acyl-CoA synthetase n=1 Tax=Aquipuribacter nitratireducens TaxID=650104 RepID=A0ABW0GQJ8_9MICO
MREFTVPPAVEAYPGTMADILVDRARNAPDAAMFARRDGDEWRDVSAAEHLAEATTLAKGLVAAGIAPGDRVAIMSRTRYEWTLADHAIWLAGGVSVPIYETSSAEQVAWILSDSGAKAVFVEAAHHRSTVEAVADRVPACAHTWVFDEGGLDTLAELGADVADDAVDAAHGGRGAGDLATIIYTSGTTGRPKGCELTHGNFIDLCRNAEASLWEVLHMEGASTLLFLPLAHIFARFIQALCVVTGVRMGHQPDPKELVDALGGFRPTFILSVPRVFEKVYNSAEQKATGEGKGKIFAAAAQTAIDWSRAQDSGGPGVLLRAKHALFDRLVYVKLRDRLGGKVRYAVSGGAPLGERLGHFFRGIGLIVLEGYGLTETTAPATVNVPERVKIGSVGKPIPGCGVRIEDDGEICLSGVNVLRGYYNNPTATSESIVDGWFRTGDLGELDDEGYLRITGRKKEIIVTAGGKNVAPAQLEDRIRAHPLISQCMVVGDKRAFVAALVTLDPEMLPVWLENQGKPAMSPAEAATDADVLAAVQSAIDDANTLVSKAESIRKFTVLTDDFTEASGHLTPSMKLKRNVVLKDYEAQVEKLYG